MPGNIPSHDQSFFLKRDNQRPDFSISCSFLTALFLSSFKWHYLLPWVFQIEQKKPNNKLWHPLAGLRVRLVQKDAKSQYLLKTVNSRSKSELIYLSCQSHWLFREYCYVEYIYGWFLKYSSTDHISHVLKTTTKLKVRPRWRDSRNADKGNVQDVNQQDPVKERKNAIILSNKAMDVSR